MHSGKWVKFGVDPQFHMTAMTFRRKLNKSCQEEKGIHILFKKKSRINVCKIR